MPEEFIEFIENVRQCGFEERPDYQGLRTMLRDLFYKMGFEYDYEFDWVILRR
jgi:casein kinase 1